MTFVQYVGNDGCSDNGYLAHLRSRSNTILDWSSSRPNSSVYYRLDGAPLEPEFNTECQEFYDLSIMVYLVDQVISRSSSNDFWTRRLNCVFPVQSPTIWRANEAMINNNLGFLSGDLWEFQWPRANGSRPSHSHRAHLPADCDTVCLFSGGIDSLLGAARLLEEGHKVLLVGHQSEGQTASAQTSLARQLNQLFPNQLHLVQGRVARSRRENVQFPQLGNAENSHRTRSFLFLALGLAVAVKCGIDRIFMPENGFMALNIPIQKSRIGSLSTRTAHPTFILGVTELARELVGYQGNIINPFLAQSKTDMLNHLPPNMRPLILRSISCSRTSRYNDRGVRHCGYCIPCIHRRIALMEAGLDSPTDYAFDVIGNFESTNIKKLHDFKALVRFASEVAQSSEANLIKLILSHGYFPPDAINLSGVVGAPNYQSWVDMLQRWSTNFIMKVRREVSASTRRVLGISPRRRSH